MGGCGGCGRVGSLEEGAGKDEVAESACVGLWALKQVREQLGVLVSEGLVGKRVCEVTYYGSAQVGHLYFFGSMAQTPQRTSAIFGRSCLFSGNGVGCVV